MNAMLKNMSRTEIVRQLELSCKALEHTSSSVVSMTRDGFKKAVVKITEDDKGVFVWTLSKDNPFIRLAPMMGSTMHEHTVEEVVEALKACKHEEVWIQWPDKDPRTVVGKIVSFGHGDVIEAYLWPVPSDIDAVNEEVRKMCAEYGCKSAEQGLMCGECDGLPSCDIIEKVDKEITERKG